jgi:hypothetical protein
MAPFFKKCEVGQDSEESLPVPGAPQIVRQCGEARGRPSFQRQRPGYQRGPSAGGLSVTIAGAMCFPATSPSCPGAGPSRRNDRHG